MENVHDEKWIGSGNPNIGEDGWQILGPWTGRVPASNSEKPLDTQ